MPEKTCPGCGAKFVCGSGPAKEPCWCADLPPILPVPSPDAGCWCPECLGREIARRQRDSPCGRPGPEPPAGKAQIPKCCAGPDAECGKASKMDPSKASENFIPHGGSGVSGTLY